VRTLAEELYSVPADPHGWLRLPFGPIEAPASVQRRIERGLYRGPVDLYWAEALCTFAYTQVAVRAGETPVALAGYFILPESLQKVTGAAAELAAELAAAVHGLTAVPPAERDVPWEELPSGRLWQRWRPPKGGPQSALTTGRAWIAGGTGTWQRRGKGPRRSVPGCRRG
jgi:hypothetical protein